MVKGISEVNKILVFGTNVLQYKYRNHRRYENHFRLQLPLGILGLYIIEMARKLPRMQLYHTSRSVCNAYSFVRKLQLTCPQSRMLKCRLESVFTFSFLEKIGAFMCKKEGKFYFLYSFLRYNKPQQSP